MSQSENYQHHSWLCAVGSNEVSAGRNPEEENEKTFLKPFQIVFTLNNGVKI